MPLLVRPMVLLRNCFFWEFANVINETITNNKNGLGQYGNASTLFMMQMTATQKVDARCCHIQKLIMNKEQR